MARYKLTLTYDGSGFVGSQRQAAIKTAGPSLSRTRTVQGELEKALQKLGWAGRSVIMSGRTDTGVHATGQVAAVDLDWSHADDELVRALNAALPTDMAVRFVEAVDEKFHPRFDAIARLYCYRLFCQPLRDPLRERFAWRVWPAAKLNALADTAKLFFGTHDFSAFGSPTTPKGTTVRTVMKADWRKAGDDEWHFEVQADAFLYRMVRRLVFVQAAVAQGKASAEAIANSLAKQARAEFDRSVPAETRSGLPSGLAPAHGLTLVEVKYKE
jgi:tRNA pseudouridine38-40 synthase